MTINNNNTTWYDIRSVCYPLSLTPLLARPLPMRSLSLLSFPTTNNTPPPTPHNNNDDDDDTNNLTVWWCIHTQDDGVNSEVLSESFGDEYPLLVDIINSLLVDVS